MWFMAHSYTKVKSVARKSDPQYCVIVLSLIFEKERAV